MKSKNTKPQNFRLSKDAINLLSDIADGNGLTKTAVIEHCVARYALEMGVEIERARSLLLSHIAEGVASSDGKKLRAGQ